MQNNFHPLRALCAVAAIFALLLGVALLMQMHVSKARGQSSGNEDPVFKYASSSTKWVGKDIATTIVGDSSGRSYLEITNLSGATSSPTALYCAVGAAPALYSGIVIHASSTRIWGRGDSVPVGAVKCLSANASSTAAFVAK